MELQYNKDTFISKLGVKNKILYTVVQWKDNETDIFHIQIFHEDCCWSGRFSREFAKQFSNNNEETEHEYLNNVKKGLTSNNETFSYDFAKASDNSAKFTWKKRFEGSSSLFVHGSVPVHKDQDQDKNALLDIILAENSSLKYNIDLLNNKYEIVNYELEKCKQELDQFVNVNTSLEQTLYGKFIKLLNAKKRRIELLEENLNSLAGSADDST